ncbi:MAG: flippase [Patescibacteria group bacterium]|nr:flippase [Patescibacteria group bacterium]MDD5173089.1 flippase [Patescibacteria group bacterium]
MTLTRSVAKNFIIQIIGRVLALFLGLFVISLLMRYLGPKDYGYYSTAVAFLQIFGIIADFGLYLITLRYLGETDSLSEQERPVRTSFVLNNIFTLRFFSAFIFYGGAFVFCLFLPYSGMVKTAVGILSGSFFFCTLIQMLSAFYQQTLQTKKIFWGEIWGKIITLTLMIIFVRRNFSFYAVLSVFGLGHLLNFLILFFSVPKKTALKFGFDFSFWKEIIRQSWPVGLAIVLNVFYFKADTLILSFYHSPEEVGLYGACYRILEVLITVPPLFLGLILPKMTSAWQQKQSQRLKNLVQKSFDLLVAISLPMVLGTIILGGRIMILLGGREFGPAGDVLKVVIIAAGILFVAELFKNLAVGLGKQKQILPFYFLVMALSLIGYFVFIPKYSYWGAAWVTVFSEILMFVFAFLLFRKTTGISFNLKIFFKSLMAGLAMSGVLMLCQNFNLVFSIVLGAAVYGVSLYFFKGIDRNLLKDVLNSNK